MSKIRGRWIDRGRYINQKIGRNRRRCWLKQWLPLVPQSKATFFRLKEHPKGSQSLRKHLRNKLCTSVRSSLTELCRKDRQLSLVPAEAQWRRIILLSLKGQGAVDFRLFGKGRTSGWPVGSAWPCDASEIWKIIWTLERKKKLQLQLCSSFWEDLWVGDFSFLSQRCTWAWFLKDIPEANL